MKQNFMNVYSVLKNLFYRDVQRLQSTECQDSYNFNEIWDLFYKDYQNSWIRVNNLILEDHRIFYVYYDINLTQHHIYSVNS